MTPQLKALSAVLIAALFAAAVPASASAEEHDWTGAYVGVNAGAGMSSGHVDDPDCWTCTAASFNERLLQAGVNAGYNKQFDSLVLGLGAEINLGSQHHVGMLALDDGTNAFANTMSKINWTGAVMARAGLAVQNSMFYLAAGPALAHAEGVSAGNGDGYNASFNAWLPGLKTAVGLEFMVSPRVSIQAQYSMLNVAERTALGMVSGTQFAHTVWANSQSAATVGAAWHF